MQNNAMANNALLTLFGDDKDVILYRRRLNQITGSVTASILLQQVYHRWKANKYKPFYKFTAPCSHSAYREGDSWIEELGFTPAEFEGARNRLAAKLTRKATAEKDKGQIVAENMIVYWTDADRKTWYEVNAELLSSKLTEIYNDEIAIRQNTEYVNEEKPITRKSVKVGLSGTETQRQRTEISLDSEKSKPLSSDEEWNNIPTANDGVPPKLDNPAVADPTLAGKETEQYIAAQCQAVLPTAITKRTQKGLTKAARQIAELKIPRDKLDAYFAYLGNGAGKRLQNNPDANWYLISSQLATWQARGYPALAHGAPETVDRTQEFLQQTRQR